MKKNINEELKSCPFCGYGVKIEDEVDFYMICCENCGAGTTFSCCDEESELYEFNREETIKAWNTRS